MTPTMRHVPIALNFEPVPNDLAIYTASKLYDDSRVLVARLNRIIVPSSVVPMFRALAVEVGAQVVWREGDWSKVGPDGYAVLYPERVAIEPPQEIRLRFRRVRAGGSSKFRSCAFLDVFLGEGA
jgi:hypothetical protein